MFVCLCLECLFVVCFSFDHLFFVLFCLFFLIVVCVVLVWACVLSCCDLCFCLFVVSCLFGGDDIFVRVFDLLFFVYNCLVFA